MSVFQSQFQAPQIVKELKNWKPVSGRCNILLFGLSGAGKSSLINTLASNKEMVTRAAKIRYDGIGQCTVTYNKYTFVEEEDAKVSICDTWGVFFGGQKDDNYSESNFRTMLKGSVQENHRVDDEMYENEAQDNDRIIDAVIFVVGSDVKDNPNILLNMRKFYNLARNYGVPVFVAVTKIDLFFEEVEKKNILTEREEKHAATQVHQSRPWKGLQQFIRTNINDPQAIVLPIINYTQLDTFANHIINFFCEEFVKVLTSRIDDFYRRPPTPDPGRDKVIKWSSGYFRNEKVNTLNFEEKGDLSLAIPKIGEDSSEFDDEEGKYVALDSFYTLLKLGRTKWRFFLVVLRSEKLEIRRICGLYNPDNDVFFESEENTDVSREDLEQSFGDKFVGSYSYLSGSGKESLDSFHLEMTQHIKLSLKEHHLTLTKVVKWKPVHSIIVNYIAERKEREEVQRILEEKFLFQQERVKKLEQGLKTLNKSMRQLSGIVTQRGGGGDGGGQQQPQQHGGGGGGGGGQARIMQVGDNQNV